MASTSAPSPIYPLYLRRWGFSVTILTVVFAVYVAGLVGLAVGGGVTGLLVQAGPRPDAVVFRVLTVAFVVLAALVLAIPESVTRRAGRLASLRPRVRVPRATRRAFLAAVPAIVAGWSVTGLFLASHRRWWRTSCTCGSARRAA
jgi:hypothetical protein